MKLTQKDKETLEILRNISGETLNRVDNVLKALMVYTIINYSENEVITIPHFGTFKLMFKGDEFREDESSFETMLDTFYSPSEELKLNIGKLEYNKANGGSLLNLPIIQELSKSIEKQIKKEMD